MYRVKFVFLMKSMQGEDTRRWMTHGGSGDMTDFHDKGLLSQRTVYTAQTALHTSSAFISDNDVSLFNHVLISYANVISC